MQNSGEIGRKFKNNNSLIVQKKPEFGKLVDGVLKRLLNFARKFLVENITMWKKGYLKENAREFTSGVLRLV